MTSPARELLNAVAASARSPFITDERTGYRTVASSVEPAPRVYAIADVVDLPRREWVLETALFAYSAAVIGAFVPDVRKRFPIPMPKHGRVQGIPAGRTDLTDRGLTGLFRAAEKQADGLRASLFEELASSLLRDDQGGTLFRFGEIIEGPTSSLSTLISTRKLNAIVGIDTSRPDLGESHLFNAVSGDRRLLPRDDFTIVGDVVLTSELAAGERTGLFRRTGGPVPTEGVGCEHGSCYVRIDARLPPIRLDILGPAGQLPAEADRAIRTIEEAGLLAPGSTMLSDNAGLLGGTVVTLPTFAEPLLAGLRQVRATSPVVDVYRARGVDVTR